MFCMTLIREVFSSFDINAAKIGDKAIPVATKAARVFLVCPKCGINKKTGQLSCCARGGAWFKNCGDFCGANVTYTWFEGIRACEGEETCFIFFLMLALCACLPCIRNNKCVLSFVAANVTASTSACPQCGKFAQSGKLSCCARGGAWFKSCGDPGDTKYEHTWEEGTETCKCSSNVMHDVFWFLFCSCAHVNTKHQRLRYRPG